MQPGELLFGVATDPGQVSAALARVYKVEIGPPTAGRWTGLDTADWRLHGAGLTLSETRQGRRRSLVLSADESGPLTGPAPTRAWPHRIDDLPDSPVRDRIARTVGIRALLPLAEVGTRSVAMHVLDAEDKTRVRLRIDQQRLVGRRPAPLPLRVLVTPLRGYDRDGQRCTDLLREAMTPMDDVDTASAAAFVAAGHRPGQLAVPPVLLDPDAPAAESLAMVLRRWMHVIESVRAGVLADIDPEYLHDLRTSVRGIRSLLRLGAESLSETQAANLAADFAWLGHLTAPLRDLDVSLLEFAGSDGDLAGLDLEPLRRHLAGQRRRALADVRRGLLSPRGQAVGTEWATTLDGFSPPDLPGPTTRSAASRQALTAYRRIVKAARPVTDESAPEELHRLRGRCKQMRYLLDAYASVYAPEPHREVLSALKALQDCLGEIQDVDVQRRQLTDLATALRRRDVDTETLLAIGALRDRIRRRDTAARRTLARRLDRFCSARMRARTAALEKADA